MKLEIFKGYFQALELCAFLRIPTPIPLVLRSSHPNVCSLLASIKLFFTHLIISAVLESETWHVLLGRSLVVPQWAK